MASHRAIAAVSEAIRELLLNAYDPQEFGGLNAAFQVYGGKDFQNPMQTGVSLFLYRVEVNGTMRNAPPRVGVDGKLHRPALPLDLHYIVTGWADTATSQQLLLGWAMRVLEDTAILPSGLLNTAWPGTFRPEESVEIVTHQLTPQELFTLWDVLKPNVQTSLTYLARLVNIESPYLLTEAGPVQTRTFDFAERGGP